MDDPSCVDENEDGVEPSPRYGTRLRMQQQQMQQLQGGLLLPGQQTGFDMSMAGNTDVATAAALAAVLGMTGTLPQTAPSMPNPNDISRDLLPFLQNLPKVNSMAANTLPALDTSFLGGGLAGSLSIKTERTSSRQNLGPVTDGAPAVDATGVGEGAGRNGLLDAGAAPALKVPDSNTIIESVNAGALGDFGNIPVAMVSTDACMPCLGVTACMVCFHQPDCR
jgi:hypothetical protein